MPTPSCKSKGQRELPQPLTRLASSLTLGLTPVSAAWKMTPSIFGFLPRAATTILMVARASQFGVGMQGGDGTNLSKNSRLGNGSIAALSVSGRSRGRAPEGSHHPAVRRGQPGGRLDVDVGR